MLPDKDSAREVGASEKITGMRFKTFLMSCSLQYPKTTERKGLVRGEGGGYGIYGKISDKGKKYV